MRQNDISVLLKSSKEGKPAGPDGPCRGKVVLAVLFTPEQCVHKTQSRTRAMWQCARARVPQIGINTPIEQGGKTHTTYFHEWQIQSQDYMSNANGNWLSNSFLLPCATKKATWSCIRPGISCFLSMQLRNHAKSVS